MLRPAQLYNGQLEKKNIESWYKPENIYWHGGTAEYTIDLPDNNGNCHCFVSVDKNDNVIGCISYNVDWVSMSADGFGIISFDKGNIEFAKDLYIAICDCFEVYHLNRISWNCYADNPAIRGYRNFVKKHGGRECAYFRQYIKLRDGKLHDSVSFEILASEFQGRSGKNEKRTNADRIRSMSDEELTDIILCPYDTAGKPTEIMPCVRDGNIQKLVSPDNCKKCMIEWLQSEVEE